jgi:ABC-type glycerol-3-phosphate transport system permease component
MTARDRLSRWLSPSLLALIALCFLLPFATVSCDDARTTFTGAQLVTRTVPAGGMVNEGGDCSADLSRCVQDRSSLPATVALVAALVGLVLGFVGITKGSGWCAALGIGALLWLVEPALEPLGPDVRLHAGYDLALLLFIGVGGLRLRAIRHQRRRRRTAVRVHVIALTRYLLLALLVAVVAAGSDTSIQSIGGYIVAWFVFAVVPAWIALAAFVTHWRKQRRLELAERTARCDTLLWLGPFLALGFCSRTTRPFLLPPSNSVAVSRAAEPRISHRLAALSRIRRDTRRERCKEDVPGW